MKKLHILLALVAIVLAFSACKKEEPKTTPSVEYSLQVTPIGMEMVKGTEEKIRVTINPTPDESVKTTITYSGSDERVASVDRNGVVTANALGEAVIRVNAVVGDKALSGKCEITVIADRLIISPRNLTLVEDETMQMTAALASGNPVTVVWKSLDESVATISETGLLTARVPGTTRIAVTDKKDKNNSDTCLVTVTEYIPLELSPANISLTAIGAMAELSCNKEGAEWSVDYPNLISLSGSGRTRVVTALCEGSTDVVVSLDGKTARCHVQVAISEPDPDPETDPDPEPEPETLEITPGGTQSLEATHTLQLECNIAGVEWQVESGSDLISVYQSGLVTAKVGEGTAIVSATYGDKKATVSISVWMQSFRVTPTSKSCAPNEEMTFTCNYYSLYGVEATATSSDFDSNWWGDTGTKAFFAGSNTTQQGEYKGYVQIVNQKQTNGSITFSYGGKSATVSISCSLPSLYASPSSVTMSVGGSQNVWSSYAKFYDQFRYLFFTLQDVTPVGCVTMTEMYGYVKLNAVKSGTATLRIEQFGQTVYVPITVR